jgi:hypothetical protein
MTMKRIISSSLTFGAAFAVLMAATPVSGKTKEPGGIENDGWGRPLRLPPNDIPHVPKKKMPYTHTVQEDSIEDFDFFGGPDDPGLVLPPINEIIIAADPWRDSHGLSTDWTDSALELDFYQPELLSFSPELGTVPNIPFWESAAAPDPLSEDYLLLPDGGWSGQEIIIPDLSPVPAPGALALLSLGLGSVFAGRRRR